MQVFLSILQIMWIKPKGKRLFQKGGYCDRDSSGGTARVDNSGCAP